MMDGLLDFLHDLLPASWFESAQDHFGDCLTDEVVAQSVHETSEFFGMDDPINVHEDWTTGVMTNMSWTESDDVLIFSRDQLSEMGISDKEGFDLVMTHEGAHRMLQGMQDKTHFNSHQEELCCDYMAGVRAGLNGMDEGKMQASLENFPENDSHPDGKARVKSIENGVSFAHDFMARYHRTPTFSDCLENFEQTEVFANAEFGGQTNLSPENDLINDYANSDDTQYSDFDSRHPTSVGYAEQNDDGTDDFIENKHQDTLKQLHVEDRAWNLKQAARYAEKEKIELHEAKLDSDAGRLKEAAEHARLAASYHRSMEEYKQAASICKK